MKNILILFSVLLISVPVFSQDEESEDKPIRPPFETSILIDNHTTVNPFKGSFQFEIHHRFGKMDNGISDIFGIYAPSNIRLGLNYGVNDKLMVGLGSTKDYKLQDLQWKYALLTQTRSGKIPVSVSYYGNAVLDARGEENFGPEDKFKEIHRFSYFTQLIISRKFNFKYSFQVAPSYLYYNSVEKGYKNGNFAIMAGGRAKVIGSASIIAEYHQLITQQDIPEQPKPNLSFGIEFGTATHAFQVFAANYSQIINQRNLLYNTNDLTEGDFLFGFNITVRF